MRSLCALLLVFFVWSARADAVPVFANGQGASCETCHTTFPGMTRYGMMVMMTNFQILKRHLQDQALPISARLYITSVLANKDQPSSTTVSDLSLLSGGFLGRNFTYYAEQHVIDGGNIGQTEQMWLSWNGLFGGANSFQLGKFHTPFPFMPAHAWTLGDYLLATQTTGQNQFNPNDARWGLAFNGMSNEFMYSLSFLTGAGPTGDALDFNSAHSERTLDFNMSYGGMSTPFSVGVVGIAGTSPLHDSASFNGLNGFTREGLYFGYQTNAWHYQTMYYHGQDSHPDLTEFNVPLNGYFFEVERDLGWRNHVLLRYDVASSDTLNRQYVLDISHNIQPNIALIGQALAGPNQRPQFALRLAMAGPYRDGKRYLLKDLALVDARSSTPTTSVAADAAVPPQTGDANRGALLVQANGCTGCHGATFQGKIGPALYGIEHKLSPPQIATKIANPVAPMPNFGFTATQIDDIVAYLSSLDGGAGTQSAPVVTFDPAAPSTNATISVRFSGAAPQQVDAVPIMQMGNTSMQTKKIELKPSPTDPHVFIGHLEFSMGGPWIVQLEYDGHTMTVPIDIGPGR